MSNIPIHLAEILIDFLALGSDQLKPNVDRIQKQDDLGWWVVRVHCSVNSLE